MERNSFSAVIYEATDKREAYLSFWWQNSFRELDKIFDHKLKAMMQKRTQIFELKDSRELLLHPAGLDTVVSPFFTAGVAASLAPVFPEVQHGAGCGAGGL